MGDPEFNITCVDALPEDGPQGRFVWSTHSTFGKDVTLEVATDAEWAAMNEKNGKPATDRPFYVLDRRLATFMDAADVIVTKPGGSTTAEIAYRGTPAVFDAVDGLFEWEKFGVNVLVKRGHGVKLRS